MGRVQLYCPSTKKTVDGFVIGAYQKPEQVLQGVRLAFDIKYAALYTVEAKPISDPQTLEEDDRVLVAASEDETMLPDAPYSYALYNGEEGEDVDPDIEGYGQDWQDLSDYEKRLHIASLMDQKPTTRNKLRITRGYNSVRDELLAIQQQDLSLTTTSNSSSKGDAGPATQYDALIADRWATSLDVFLRQLSGASTAGTTTKYASSSAAKAHSSLAPCTVAALAVFASLTHGQARLAGEILIEAVALRVGEEQGEDKDAVVRVDDVRSAVDMVFERAGVVPVKVAKGKAAKTRKRAKGRARRSADGGAGL